MTDFEELDADLQRLDTMLAALGDDAMVLGQLDGYLCGIAVSPDEIEEAEWLPEVLAGPVEPKDAAQLGVDLDQLQQLVCGRFETIKTELAEDRYQPLYDVDDDDILWEIWLDGFDAAMALRLPDWEKLLQSRKESRAQEAAFGMLDLLKLSDPKFAEVNDPATERDRQDAPNLIPQFAAELYRAHRLAAPQAPLRVASVGRNDPCPCGSGLKYKKCHGA